MISKDGMVTITDEEGNTYEYTVLFTFRSEELDKDYVVITDGNREENGKLSILVSYYNPESDEFDLDEVTNPDELQMAYDILNEMETVEGVN